MTIQEYKLLVLHITQKVLGLSSLIIYQTRILQQAGTLQRTED